MGELETKISFKSFWKAQCQFQLSTPSLHSWSFPTSVWHSAPWCLSVAATNSPKVHSPQEKAATLLLFLPQSCQPPLRGTVGSIPALGGQHMLHFVTLTEDFELVDEIKQITSFSWKEKTRNKGNFSESQWKLGDGESYLYSFGCTAYQHVMGSVVMKLKFLKQDQQLDWTPVLRDRTSALRISFMFNRMVTTTLLHGVFLLMKYWVEQYSVHPILPSHPDKTWTISLRSQVKSIIFFFYSFQETDYIKSIYSVSTVRPLQYTGAWCMVLAFQTFWYPVIPISYWDWKVNWEERRKMPRLLWQPRRISQMFCSPWGITR